MLSVASLYAFLLFIMFHPVKIIDTSLDVRTLNKINIQVSLLFLIANYISPSSLFTDCLYTI